MQMSDQDFNHKVKSLFDEIQTKRAELVKLLSSNPITVLDYELLSTENTPVLLSSLFGDKEELIVVHNMGKSCRYCTLWADGFSSSTSHFLNRCAFVLVSPDKPETLKVFSEERGWQFPVYSAFNTNFILDMGYAYKKEEKTYYIPGVSIFSKNGGIITRTAQDFFGPGDFYSPIWHLFDLLPKGVNEWQPNYNYHS